MSTTVSITLVIPTGYGPAGVCVNVIASPSGSEDPLLIFAVAVPPMLAAITETFLETAMGSWFTLQLMEHAGIWMVYVFGGAGGGSGFPATSFTTIV